MFFYIGNTNRLKMVDIYFLNKSLKFFQIKLTIKILFVMESYAYES